MAASQGYGKVVTSGSVFAYDVADTRNSYIGEPTTNICDGTAYSIYNEGATNYRNNTDIAPPVPGYEVVKVVANTPGVYGQSILWKADYATSPVMTITNSVYVWLSSGTYVQVGQHWYPWFYGYAQFIEKGKWIRISETYNINDGGSYGTAAMVYSTDGVAYFSMPQYEMKSHRTPFVTFSSTRSATQGLLPLVGNSTLNLTNMSFDSNAQIYFDGTNDTISTPSNTLNNVAGDITMELVLKRNSGASGAVMHKELQYTLYITSDGNVTYADSSYWSYSAFGYHGTTITPGVYHHIVATKNGSLVTIYVDGNVVVSQNFGSAITQTNNNLYIGSYDGSNSYFGGEIPVAKVYNRALTLGEVKQNYNKYKTRFNLS